MTIHPRKNDHGKTVEIHKPHEPTPLGSWAESWSIATVVPDGPMPTSINGVPVVSAPSSLNGREDWERLAQAMEFEEPPFEAKGLKPAAGAVVVEPDGRLWLVSPTNQFGHYTNTFPKGKANGLGLKATALKEVFEELGLVVELFKHLIDITRTTSRTRYYLARRKAGNPADMCWESQSAHLVPLELAKGLLNQSVDHPIIDKLIDDEHCWAGWFFCRSHDDPQWEAAKSGQVPATRADWCNLPLPVQRVRIPLDLVFDRAESANLRLGFVPRMMEQKWFTYFEGNTLFEHRSWTGFCISEVHFTPEGEGLRAVCADVNRQPRQYENTDDAEDVRRLSERLRQYARLREEDRNAEDPFVAGLKTAMAPNYLGDPRVVQGLLLPYFQAVLDGHAALRSGAGLRETSQRTTDLNKSLASIFSGENPEYQIIGAWNTVPALGASAIQALDLDPAYCADENLPFILSEGLCGVAIFMGAMFRDFDADPGAEFKRDLLPRIRELLNFTASVLMGTQTVLFPEKTLKDFAYSPAAPPPPKPGLFDLFPPDTPSEGADAPSDINELRKAFGLPLVEPEDASSPAEVPGKTGRPITLPGPIGGLAKALGGVGTLAEEVGVTPRTIRRWANGATIPKLPRKMLTLLFDKHGIDAGNLFTSSSEA